MGEHVAALVKLISLSCLVVRFSSFLLLLDSLLCCTTLLALPWMSQSLCLFIVPGWSWLSEDPKTHTFPKKKMSSHFSFIVIVSPASVIEQLHESCFYCPLPVSSSLSLLSPAFCTWMTAMKHSLISTAIFLGTPNEKILPTFSLPHTAPHKC